MANTHIVYGKIKNGYTLDALSLTSQTIANGAISTNSSITYNFCSISAIGGAVYVAFAQANGTANASNTSARVYIPAGSTMDFGLSGSIKIQTLDA